MSEAVMRLLFTLDLKNYDPEGAALIRPSVRAIILREGLVAMVHSRKYNYFKFPGGGMEPGENRIQTLIRETAEESGLHVLSDSVREYGYVHRIQKGKKEPRFIQDNYYYLCDVSCASGMQKLDDYESEAGFTLEWVTPDRAIRVNRREDHGSTDQIMLEREALVLEMLIREGYFSSKP